MPRRKGHYTRSRRYKAMAAAVGAKVESPVPIPEAVAILQGHGHAAKFDETVDLAIKLDIDTKQADQNVRGSLSLPCGLGKAKKVIAFCEGDLARQAKEAGAVEAGYEDLVKKVLDGWSDFDVAVAHPSTMREVGKLGRVLGPQGKMPSPKSGTVTPNIIDAVREFGAGKIEYRNDTFGNVHMPVGKLSFPAENLQKNVEAAIDHIKAVRPAGVKGVYMSRVTLSSTMGPGVKVTVGSQAQQ
jgi:large subunit ribosomal protein L1